MPQRPNLNTPTAPNPYPHPPDDSQNNPNGLIPVTRTQSTLAPQAFTPSHAREMGSIRQLPTGTIIFACGEASAPALDQNSGQNRLLSLLRGQPKNP